MPLDRYLNHLRLAGRRPATIRTLRKVLTALQKQIGRPVETATRWELEAYLARDLTVASRQSYCSHFRGFYRWLCEEGLREDDPSARLPSIRRPRGVPRPISDDDLALALATATPEMRAWMLLMSLAGLRCLEVAALRPTDLQVTPDGVVLFLRETKGGGTGTVPAHPAIVETLARIPERRGCWWEVSADEVSRRVGRHLRSQGIDATAHQLRHFAGTAWYEASGHDLLTTARLLRHASVLHAQTYAQVNPRRPAEVVKLVPLPSVATSTRGEVA